jgi:hypothetical protein
VDGISLLIGDFNAELLQRCQIYLPYIASVVTDLLDRHNHLYGIQTVETEIVVKVRLGVKLYNVSMPSTKCLEATDCYLGSILDLHLR